MFWRFKWMWTIFAIYNSPKSYSRFWRSIVFIRSLSHIFDNILLSFLCFWHFGYATAEYMALLWNLKYIHLRRYITLKSYDAVVQSTWAYAEFDFLRFRRGHVKSSTKIKNIFSLLPKLMVEKRSILRIFIDFFESEMMKIWKNWFKDRQKSMLM